MKLKMNGMRLPPLPKGKSAVEVFGDYLGYLFRCTKSFIIDNHAGGSALWRAVEEDLQFVLSHPNGWEGAQQTKMRRAAIHGGLIPDTDAGKAQIRFVTEGEASLHACVLNGLAKEMLTVRAFHNSFCAKGSDRHQNLGIFGKWVSCCRRWRRDARYQLLCCTRNHTTRDGRDRPSGLFVIIHIASDDVLTFSQAFLQDLCSLVGEPVPSSKVGQSLTHFLFLPTHFYRRKTSYFQIRYS